MRLTAGIRSLTQDSLGNLLKLLVVTSLLELVLWRLLSNLGLPAGAVGNYQLYSVLRFLGPLALNLAHVVAALVSVLMAIWLYSIPRILLKMVSMIILASVQLSFLLSLVGSDPAIWFVYQITSMSAVIILALKLALNRGVSPKFLAVTLVGAYLSSVYFRVVPLLRPTLGSGIGLGEVFTVGEVFAVGSTLLLPWYLRESILQKEDFLKWGIVSSIPAIGFLLVYLKSPWLTTTLSIFSLGFSLYLPLAIYIVALWLFTRLLIGLVLLKSQIAYALLILLISGLMLPHPYLNLLSILGILLLNFNGGIEPP